MAYMGHPFASYLRLGVDTKQFDRLRGPVGLPAEILFLVSPGPSWGSGELPAHGDALVFMPGHALVVGHTPTCFILPGGIPSDPALLRRLVRIPSFPIRIEWG